MNLFEDILHSVIPWDGVVKVAAKIDVGWNNKMEENHFFADNVNGVLLEVLYRGIIIDINAHNTIDNQNASAW